MSMKYIRDSYGVPAKRGMPVVIAVGQWAGRKGVIRRADYGILVVTDKPGAYSWMVKVHPDDLDYCNEQESE